VETQEHMWQNPQIQNQLNTSLFVELLMTANILQADGKMS